MYFTVAPRRWLITGGGVSVGQWARLESGADEREVRGGGWVGDEMLVTASLSLRLEN